MANQITTNFSHTYSGQEDMTIYRAVWEASDHSANYTFMDNVKDKRYLYIRDAKLSKIMKAYVGCGSGSTNGTLAITDRELDVNKVRFYTEECVDAFENSAWENEILNTITQNNLLENPTFADLLLYDFYQATIEDKVRVDWFGNTDDADGDWNQYNGWFKWFTDRAIVPSGQYLDLSSSTYTASGTNALQTDAALAIFRKLTGPDKADLALRYGMRGEAKLYVTPSILENYKETLQNTSNVDGQRQIIDGRPVYYFDGIQIVEMPIWEQHLADTTNPFYDTFNANGQHVAVYTAPKNLVIGSDVGVSDRGTEAWYEKKDEKVYMRRMMRRGTTYLHSTLVTIAY